MTLNGVGSYFVFFFTKFGGFAGFVRFLENACQTWAP